MIADRLFERFPCDAVYGMHTAPGLPVSTIATTAGPVMAAAGTFEVTFAGPGGRGGQGAHLTADLIVVQAAYVMALQTIVARNVPAEPVRRYRCDNEALTTRWLPRQAWSRRHLAPGTHDRFFRADARTRTGDPFITSGSFAGHLPQIRAI
jgi:hypothetical protein